jgi:hypothetical protein
MKEQKQKDYFRILEKKIKINIKKDVLKKSIKIIAESVSKLFLFEKIIGF